MSFTRSSRAVLVVGGAVALTGSSCVAMTALEPSGSSIALLLVGIAGTLIGALWILTSSTAERVREMDEAIRDAIAGLVGAAAAFLLVAATLLVTAPWVAPSAFLVALSILGRVAMAFRPHRRPAP